MGTCIVDEEDVAHVDARQGAVDRELVAVLAQTPHHVVHMVGGLALLAEHRDVVVGAVDRRPHEVGRAGVDADVLLVDVLLVDGGRQQRAEGREHEAAELGQDGDVAHAGGHQDPVEHLVDARPDGLDVVCRLLGPVVDPHAAREVDGADMHARLVRDALRKLEELGGQRRIVVVRHGVGGEERVDAEVARAERLEPHERLDHLVLAHAVLGLAGVVHDAVAQLEDPAGVVAAEHGLGDLRDALEEVDHREVVEVDERPEPGGLEHVERRRLVRGEHDLVAGKAACLREQELGVARAVDAAALLLQDLKQRRVRRRLDGEVLPEPRVPRERAVHGARPLAYARLVVEVERGRHVGDDRPGLLHGHKRFLLHEGGILSSSGAAEGARPPATGRRQTSGGRR